MGKPRLNYIEQVNGFWRLNLTQSLRPTEIALYYYLLHVNNSCGWKKSFFHNNKKIEATLSISFKTLAASRTKLKESGLIEFKTKNGSPNVLYQLQTLSKFPKVREEVRDKVSDEVRDEINKTKEKQNNNNREIDEASFINSIKNEENRVWRESIYEKYKLKKGSLEKLIKDFMLSNKTLKNSPHSTLKEFIKHFVNWLNVREEHGKLREYKKHQLNTGAI